MSCILDDALRDDLRLLTMQLLDRSLSRDQALRLFGLLRSNPAARRFYLQEMHLSGSLYWDNATELRSLLNQRLAEHGGASPAVATTNPLPKIGFLGATAELVATALSSPKALAVGVSSALLTYFVVLAVSIAISRGPWANRGAPKAAKGFDGAGTGGAASRSPARAEVGSLAAGAGARWSGVLTASADSVARAGQRYDLREGRARMLLAGGASIVVQGPAVWQLESEQRLLLDSGKLLAHVPKAAVGFTVVTPTAEIIDLGTDFSVVVDDHNQSRLAVTQGAVQVTVRPDPAFKLMSSRPAPLRVVAGVVVNVSRLAAGTTVLQPGAWDAAWTRQIADLALPLDESTGGRLVAYRTVPDGAAGNQFDFVGSLGLDFKVSRAIRVCRLGVFDHLGDGIDPESTMIVHLWSRDTQGTEETDDDTGARVLASVEMTAAAPGELKFGHRFAALAKPVRLDPGEYTIVAHGFSPKNPDLNFGFGPDSTTARSEVESGPFAIAPIGSRCELHGASGVFPSKYERITVRYCAGSFEFETDD